MVFESFSKLEGQHAILGASQHAWLRYDDDKLKKYYESLKAKEMGTRLHALAAEHIDLGIRMPKSDMTLNKYINDAIGYKMTPEQILYFSDHSFGTADSISFRKNILRIHDLKTGVHPAYKTDKKTGEYVLEQLEIYAALFCLQYGEKLGFKPNDIQFELAIYQNNDIFAEQPDPSKIIWTMDRIKHCSDILDELDVKEEKK